MSYTDSIRSRMTDRRDRGVTMVEYALVVALVATGSVGTFEMMDAEIEEHYEESAADIGNPDLNSFDVVTTTTVPTSSSTTSSTSTTTVPASLVQDASSAAATGAFASDGTGIGVPDGSGNNWNGADETSSSLSFTFNVTTAGYYQIQGSVKATSGSNNSFWVTVDGTPEEGYLWDTTTSGGYTNDNVSDRDGADPVEIWLVPGEHTVGLHLREDGTYAESLELQPV